MDNFEFTQKMLREIVRNLGLEEELADVLCKRIWYSSLGFVGFTMTNRDQAVAYVVEKLRGIASR